MGPKFRYDRRTPDGQVTEIRGWLGKILEGEALAKCEDCIRELLWRSRIVFTIFLSLIVGLIVYLRT